MRSTTSTASATYEDTAVITPNSDTPYSIGWMDLRAEPMVISVPAVEKSRYYSVQLCDGNTYNYGYIGSSRHGNGSRRLHGGRPRLERRDAARNQEGLQLLDAVFDRDLSHPALQPGGHAEREKMQTGYKMQPLSAFLKQPAPPAAPTINFPKINKELAEDRLL